MNIEIEQNIEKLYSKNIGDNEKYNICYELFKLYRDVDIYKGLYYLIESEQYNKSNIYKIKCILELIMHCFNNNKYEIAELYIRSLERYYIENKMEESYEAYFVLPYHAIILYDRTGNSQLAINMYKYSFTKIFKNVPQYMIGNYIYNLQFYLDKVKKTDIDFFELANKYINNLEEAGYNIRQYDFISKYNVYGIKLNIMEIISKYTEEECRESKNILIYTGYMPHKWNYTYSLTNALGGSETAAAYLANMLPKEYTIYVAGHVEEESYDNIKYVHNDNVKELIEKTPFYTIIVSRYIDFYEQYPNFSSYKTYIWGHDIFLFSQLNTVDNIINKSSKKINGCICQTEWHKNQLLSVHSSLNNIKLYTINNGIDLKLIDNVSSNIKKKVPNRFIYSSCSERGLEKLLQLWPQIVNVLPDAELFIASYNKFPSSELDYSLKVIIDKYSSITHVGKLTKKELYSLMSSSEYWLYPTCFDETSCITAMELLANKVICLYYPRAGLVDTIGKYGIQIKEGNEIDKLLELTEEDKINYREKGRKYAEEVCNWSSRIKEWETILWADKDIKWLFIIPFWFYPLVLIDYLDSLKSRYNLDYIKIDNSNNNLEEIKKYNPNRITFILGVYNNTSIVDYAIKNNIEISMLNTEPLTLTSRLNEFRETVGHLSLITTKFKVYDYSKSNIKILNNAGIENTEHLPYQIYEEENKLLTKLYKETPKKYDFGFIGGLVERRKEIVEYIKNNTPYTVNIIEGWKEERDKKMAECRIILNIHGWYNEPTNIFEHIRCDRLLEAGFKILSEESYELDPVFKEKYCNLHIIKYEDFFKNNVLDSCIILPKNNNICFIHSCTINNNISRLEYLINKIIKSQLISILDKIIINNIGNDININALNIYNNAYNNKIIINNYSSNIELQEIPTINLIKKYSAVNKNVNILYLHTKGVRYSNDNKKQNDWIDMMLYFLCDLHNECIDKLLNGYDCIGCNYHNGIITPYPKHFSGNFWWTSSSYINTLEYLDDKSSRNDAEFWICKNNPKVYEMHNSNIDHYLEEYPMHKYIINKIKIIDCFTFYNELDLLEYRLNVLNDVVDYFIIVEANQTFIGKQKELYFNNNKGRFDKFKDKIIHIIVDLPYISNNININKGEQWLNEKYQRNCISIGFNKLQLNDNDIILINDLDEIPDPNKLISIKSNIIDINIHTLVMDFYYYNLHNKHLNKWYLSKILSYKKYKELNITCDEIRNYNSAIIEKGGWHLSYFGTAEFIKNKIQQFSHQELNLEEFTNIEKIKYRVNNNIDLYDRPNDKTEYISIKNNTYLPPLYDYFLTKFYKAE